MKNFIFLASIEGDLLIFSAISVLIKEISPESNTILLLPGLDRVINKKNDYSVLFDKIIEIDALQFSKKPLAIFNNLRKIKKLFYDLKQYTESIFFLLDIYNLNELVVYSFIQKNRNAKMVTVTAFEGDEIDFSNLQLVIKGTFAKSLYSLVLLKKLFYEYRIKNSSNSGINYFKAQTFLQLCIKKSKFRNSFGKYYGNLPYPPGFLNTHTLNMFTKSQLIDPNSIIIFFETQISHWSEDYWKSLNELIDLLYQKGVNIYIKDHPNCKESYAERVLNASVKVLPKEISAEILYLANRVNILAVFAHGSTALVTASWLNIPSYDVSEYFGFSKPILIKLSQFLRLGENIVKIFNIRQIEKLEFKPPQPIEEGKEKNIEVWKEIFIKELGI